MKILIVRPFPNIINPHQYNVQEIGLAKALTRRGYQCGIVLYNGKNKDSIEHMSIQCNNEIRDIIIYKLHGINIFKNGFFPSLKKLVDEYDIIQVHEYDQIMSWLLYAWSKKKVVIYHGPYYHDFNKRYNTKCKVFDNVFLKIKHNRDVMCMTKSTLAEEFLKSKGFKNVRTVGVGLDIENFDIGSDEDIPIDITKKNIIYVGKMEERRNSLFLLELMQELHKRIPEINCVIVGSGEREYLRNIIPKIREMQRDGYLQYYEKATQKQLAGLYRKAKLMLFPSNYEIFGMVLLEAAYFGLPVITSKNGGADIFIQNQCRGKVLMNFDMQEWIGSSIEILSQDEEDISINRRFEIVSWDAKVSEFIKCYNI